MPSNVANEEIQHPRIKAMATGRSQQDRAGLDSRLQFETLIADTPHSLLVALAGLKPATLQPASWRSDALRDLSAT